jgi:small GTP-binding protein
VTSDFDYQDWKNYLEEIYTWINERYHKFMSGEISQNDYNVDYQYYQTELERVNEILSDYSKLGNKKPLNQQSKSEDEGTKSKTSNEVPKSSRINPEMIEGFFFGDKKLSENKPKDKLEKSEEGKKFPEKRDSRHDDLRKLQYQSLVNDIETKSTLSVPKEVGRSNTKIDQFQNQAKIEPVFESSIYGLEDDPTYHLSANVVLLGESSVGRTSIRRAIMGKNFIEQHLSTVGASMEKKVIVLDEKEIEFTLMDLGGQDFYASVRSNFYRNVKAALVVFDLTKRETFNAVDKWLRELYSNSKKQVLPFILVGNKKDMKREVSPEDGQRLSNHLSNQTRKNGYVIPYIEVSAKTGENVNKIFEILGRQLMQLQSNGKL